MRKVFATLGWEPELRFSRTHLNARHARRLPVSWLGIRGYISKFWVLLRDSASPDKVVNNWGKLDFSNQAPAGTHIYTRGCVNLFSFFLSVCLYVHISLSPSLSRTHTYTHTTQNVLMYFLPTVLKLQEHHGITLLKLWASSLWDHYSCRPEKMFNTDERLS